MLCWKAKCSSPKSPVSLMKIFCKVGDSHLSYWKIDQCWKDALRPRRWQTCESDLSAVTHTDRLSCFLQPLSGLRAQGGNSLPHTHLCTHAYTPLSCCSTQLWVNRLCLDARVSTCTHTLTHIHIEATNQDIRSGCFCSATPKALATTCQTE